MHENGESELARLRSEIAELRKSFNLFVRSQASLVAALRQAEETAQSRHRFTLSAINDLRSLAMSGTEQSPDRIVVTDRPGQTGQMPVFSESKSKGEISGSVKLAGVQVQFDGTGKDFKELLGKSVRWILVVLGMALTGGVGWLVGFLKQIGEAHK